MKLRPVNVFIPELRRALDALVRVGLVMDKNPGSWTVKPSRSGYIMIEKWRERRRALRARPVLYEPVKKEIYVLDQRFDRFAA